MESQHYSNHSFLLIFLATKQTLQLFVSTQGKQLKWSSALFYNVSYLCPYIERIKQTVSIDATTVDIEEKGVKLRLTVVDTPGFGDAVDNRAWYYPQTSKLYFFQVYLLCSWQPIIDYVNEKYDQYLRDESGLNRRNIEDHRVHCCLYFINPCGHGYIVSSEELRSSHAFCAPFQPEATGHRVHETAPQFGQHYSSDSKS